MTRRAVTPRGAARSFAPSTSSPRAPPLRAPCKHTRRLDHRRSTHWTSGRCSGRAPRTILAARPQVCLITLRRRARGARRTAAQVRRFGPALAGMGTPRLGTASTGSSQASRRQVLRAVPLRVSPIPERGATLTTPRRVAFAGALPRPPASRRPNARSARGAPLAQVCWRRWQLMTPLRHSC